MDRINPVGKIAKNRFLLIRHLNTVPCCQKCTPKDCSFWRFCPLGTGKKEYNCKRFKKEI